MATIEWMDCSCYCWCLFVRLFLFFLKFKTVMALLLCRAPVWTRSLEKERKTWIKPLETLSIGSDERRMSAMHERYFTYTIQLSNHSLAGSPVRLFVRLSIRSFVRLSIHRNDICCAAGAAAAAASANASTNTCAHRVLVCNALDNTLTQIRMYAFVLPMENESGE